MFVNTYPDIDYHILQYLQTPKELCKLCHVSKIWSNRITYNDSIWKNNIPILATKTNLPLKKMCDVKGIIRMEQLVKRIDEFSLTIPFTENGEFICLFPPDMNSCLTVRIINNNKSDKKTLKDDCWFVKTKPFYKQPTKYKMVFTDNHQFFVSIKLPDELLEKDLADKILDKLELNFKAKKTVPIKKKKIPYGIFNWIPGFKKSDDS